jgi:hypothetical protein
VGVPAFSCSFFAVMVTAELEGMLDSMPNEAFDATSQGAIRVGAGANDRRNSSTCSKHPRKISYKHSKIQIFKNSSKFDR